VADSNAPAPLGAVARCRSEGERVDVRANGGREDFDRQGSFVCDRLALPFESVASIELPAVRRDDRK
jgi:hypothetical protein